MNKITLILIALITVACSDPKDKYIALECTDPNWTDEYWSEYVLVMDKDSKTFENYFTKFPEDFPEELKESLLQTEIGPENILISGTYIEEGDHHYLYTWGLESTQKLLAKREYFQEVYESYAEIGEQAPPVQFKFDRRDFSYSSKEIKAPNNDEVWTDYSNQDCKVIDVPEDYLASKKNKDVNLF